MTRETGNNPRTSRRQLLKTAGLGIATLAFQGIGSAQTKTNARPPWARSQSKSPAPPEYYVKGTQTKRVQFKPDEVVIHKQRRSIDLKKRYGLQVPVIKDTERIKRENPEKDGFPRRKTYVETSPWETYYAKDDEWTALYTKNDENGGSDRNSVSASNDSSLDVENPYGVWEYNQVNGGYEIVAPMNIISPARLTDVMDVFESANNWTTLVWQHNRWAWNSDANTFQKQHNSAATSTDGANGRHHIRMWEFGGYVSGCAHEDSGFPHSAISYHDAEVKVEDAFKNENGWWAYHDWYNLDNGGKMDHDGKATRLA